ncbi:MAG: DUF3846 domain-containing protein [Aeriscardovia sp.]|nr:DUF3846 domain-containing protein [Clostridia bacterium]MBO5627900.1 DUF3846 domain-containing protein [Aeriscardovia sp.]
MAKKIRVLLIKPMETPHIVMIEHTLDNLQKLVGGTIQAVYPWEDPVALICNDDGIALGLPLNRMLKDEDGQIYDIIHGTFFITGLSRDNFTSISDKLAEKFRKLFHYPELYMQTEDGLVVCFKIGSYEQPIIII